MCLGVPGRVVEVTASPDLLRMATVEFGGIRREVCLACVPEASAGDYVIVHAGIAISLIDPDEAAKITSYLNEIVGEEEGWHDEIRE
jgi:hydrogenase expression/formation protein HypC